MITGEENELLCRVGPGTLMGELLRQYWTPVIFSSELEKDGPPKRVRLLGENLIAFRETQGRVGLLADNCSHRGASLFFGRNEEGGVRCVYHGWKYDVEGRCVDMPNEPPESNFKEKIQHVAYPCQEHGGVIWTYMGPRREPPLFPDLEWTKLPPENRNISQTLRQCNWMQGLEGDIDTSHLYFSAQSDRGWRQRASGGVPSGQIPALGDSAYRLWREVRGTPGSRRKQLLLAHHPVHDALPHPVPAGRCRRGPGAYMGTLG